MSKVLKFFSFLERVPPEFSKPLDDQGHEVDDDPEMEQVSLDSAATSVESKQPIEGQAIGIEYLSAKGEKTIRRVSIKKITVSDGGLMHILAFCHLRKRIRNFRSDRISAVYDDDGVIMEPEDFWVLFDIGGASNPVALVDDKTVREDFCHELRLLTAMGRADGRLLKSEVLEVLRYADDETHRRNVYLDGEGSRLLERYVRRLYPAIESVEESLSALGKNSEAQKERFIHAAVAVMNADHKQTQEEFEFLIALSTALGVRTVINLDEVNQE